MSSDNTLEKKYTFQNSYIKSYADFKNDILTKKVIPSQVEFQAPPKSKKKICWMECPYCYGLSAEDNGDRINKDRGLEVLNQIIKGGVNKIIFAGYATDPLNCDYIDDLLEMTIDNKAIFGFNTKILKVSDRFVSLLNSKKLSEGSYMSLSIDAGSNETYKKIHNINSSAPIYDRVLNNVKKIGSVRKSNNSFDLSAAYLLNVHSAKIDDCKKFIENFIDAGCNLLRFTFPQPPKDIITEKGVVPNPEEKKEYKEKIQELILKYKNDECPIIFVDADEQFNIYNKPQTLPCYARYIYPTVGFDGWLYNCSQSSAPNFRDTALGDLNKEDFWKLYYNYQADDFNNYSKKCNLAIKNSGCRCDRKEHIVNADLGKNLKF
jgi:sulfatase maturation enzyme AslB (radical SAM superfamily)